MTWGVMQGARRGVMLFAQYTIQENTMRKRKTYYVYMMTNQYNNVLYTGVTNDIERRVWEHRNGQGGAFTSKYKVRKLVYMLEFQSIKEAINAEKSLKATTRARKERLIRAINPEWEELMPE